MDLLQQKTPLGTMIPTTIPHKVLQNHILRTVQGEKQPQTKKVGSSLRLSGWAINQILYLFPVDITKKN